MARSKAANGAQSQSTKNGHKTSAPQRDPKRKIVHDDSDSDEEMAEGSASDENAEGPGEDLSTSDPNDISNLDPYALLSVPRDATDADIKKAYRRMALLHHPDKVSPADKDAATHKFHLLTLSHTLLLNPTHRARYDATGHVPTSASALSDPSLDPDAPMADWAAFFKARRDPEAFSEAAIRKFKASYQGSEEETRDVLTAYEDSKGDMGAVMESVMGCEEGVDEERFVALIQSAVLFQEVKAYKRFEVWVKEWKEETRLKDDKYASDPSLDAARARVRARQRKRKREEEEAREMAREMGVEDKLFPMSAANDTDVEEDEDDDDEDTKSAAQPSKKSKKSATKGADSGTDALASIIRSRQQERAGDFLAGLEAKYAPKKKGKGKGKKDSDADEDGMKEPPESAFEAMGKRMEGAKAGQKKKGAKR